MNALADGGFVLFGGPLAGSEQGRVRVLLIVDAEGEADVRSRLADDPWEHTSLLAPVSVERWDIFVGAERGQRDRSRVGKPRSVVGNQACNSNGQR